MICLASASYGTDCARGSDGTTVPTCAGDQECTGKTRCAAHPDFPFVRICL